VPAKLGTTKAYKETFTVIVPYTVNEGTAEGDHTISVNLTYTPGYNAGRFSTHNKETYSTTIKVDQNATATGNIPQAKNGTVADDFIVAAKTYDNVSPFFRFMFTPLKEETSVLHHKLLTTILCNFFFLVKPLNFHLIVLASCSL
jgi:hypothetical protein